MIIAIAGQKGGSGKSTLAIHLAAEWCAAGNRVLLVDADPQGTSLTWSEVADEQGHAAPDTVAVGNNLKKVVPELARGYDVTVVDCPGRMRSKRQLGAMLCADLVLLPCGPSTPDVWALAESVELFTEVQDLRPELAGLVVLNRLGNTGESRAVAEALSALTIPLAQHRLGQRVAFSEALASGLGVTVDQPSSVAAGELRNIAREIEERIREVGRAA